MASLPVNFAVDAVSSSYSVKDAIASYRRAQYFATLNVPSASAQPRTQDEELGPVDLVEDLDNSTEADDESHLQDGIFDQFEWDDIGPASTAQNEALLSQPGQVPHSPQLNPPRPGASENSPLLRKAASFSYVILPRHLTEGQSLDAASSAQTTYQLDGQVKSALLRRTSTGSTEIMSYGGKSTYRQTLFNSIAILLGVGMLSEPLAFSYAGWVGGTVLIIFYGFITCYTAKLLARIILDDPRLRSYTDIGRKAFGPKSTTLTSILFCLELFALSVVLVTLYADSLHSVAPAYSANTYKLWGLIILIPSLFLPLSLLSYASMMGIASIFSIIVVILVDGFSKPDSPGSLWSPADTQLGIGTWSELGIAIGLFMAGFSGHAVIPSLAKDMVDPQQFDHMINRAFIIATFIYAVIGSAGYLMFGSLVSDEVSKDLLRTPGYNPYMNQATLWMLVISPLSKFALATRPLNITVEIMLGLETTPPPSSPEDNAKAPLAIIGSKRTRHPTLKRFFIIIERIAFTLLSVGVSIVIPEFSSAMAFLGSFSAFIICVIGPVYAKSALAGRWEAWDVLLWVVAIVMAVWGTAAAFMSS